MGRHGWSSDNDIERALELDFARRIQRGWETAGVGKRRPNGESLGCHDRSRVAHVEGTPLRSHGLIIQPGWATPSFGKLRWDTKGVGRCYERSPVAYLERAPWRRLWCGI